MLFLTDSSVVSPSRLFMIRTVVMRGYRQDRQTDLMTTPPTEELGTGLTGNQDWFIQQRHTHTEEGRGEGELCDLGYH